MVLHFIRNNIRSYGAQTVCFILFSVIVYGYVSDIGFGDIGFLLESFVQRSGPFFIQVMTDSAYSYLFLLPFVAIPFAVLWWLFKRHFFKYRVQQIEKHSTVHFVHDLIESIFSTLSFVLLFMVQAKWAEKGYVRLYNDFDAQPWYWLPIAIVTWLLIEDAWFYWWHRAMHHKWVFKYVHESHHVSVDSSPLTQNAFNFVESLIVPMGAIVATMLVPSWGPAYFAFQLFGQISNMVAHSGYEFYPRWTLSWKTNSTHHNMHHQYFDGNYGTHLTFWDKLCGTEFPDYRERFLEIKDRTNKTARS